MGMSRYREPSRTNLRSYYLNGFTFFSFFRCKFYNGEVGRRDSYSFRKKKLDFETSSKRLLILVRALIGTYAMGYAACST